VIGAAAGSGSRAALWAAPNFRELVVPRLDLKSSRIHLTAFALDLKSARRYRWRHLSRQWLTHPSAGS
jgi:hypothetical protein